MESGVMVKYGNYDIQARLSDNNAFILTKVTTKGVRIPTSWLGGLQLDKKLQEVLKNAAEVDCRDKK